MQRKDVEKIQDELGTKVYRATDIVDNPNITEVLQLFSRYFFIGGTFPTRKNLVYVPEGKTRPFLNADEKISPFELYKKLSSSQVYGLVSTQFLCALNISVGGEKQLSKYAMSKFLSNLSVQVLNRENDTIQLNFRYLKELCDNIKNLLRSDKVLMYNKMPDTFMKYSPPEFEQVKNKNQVIEENVVENIISDRRLFYPQDNSYMSFPNTPREIEEQAKFRDEANKRLLLAMQPYDKEFLAAEGRKKVLDAIEKTGNNFAFGVISNLLEVEANKIKTDNDGHVEKSNVAAIFSRVDAAQNISVKPKEKETPLPSLTDIIVSSPDGKVRDRRSRCIQEKEKPYDKYMEDVDLKLRKNLPKKLINDPNSVLFCRQDRQGTFKQK